MKLYMKPSSSFFFPLPFRQCRLASYRIVLDWLLKGETLGKGTRIIHPSCVVSAIRRAFPSADGRYRGFLEEAGDLAGDLADYTI